MEFSCFLYGLISSVITSLFCTITILSLRSK